MKILCCAAALSVALSILATGVDAGGLAAPVMAPEVIVADTTATSNDFVVPLLGLALLIAVFSSSGGGAVAGSDARLKTDIERVGTTAHNLPLYRFSYVGLPGTYEGVMAQDVARVMPGALITMPQGFFAVDYAKLGLRMHRID